MSVSMNMLNDSPKTYLQKKEDAYQIIEKLGEIGDIYLIGGALRAYRDNSEIDTLRDIDIIVDSPQKDGLNCILNSYPYEINNFGGYKIVCDGLVLDFWELKNTWAFASGVIKCAECEYVNKLQESVFLNVDAIIYDWKRNKWYDKGYKAAMKQGILDVVLCQNPHIPLNVIRAMILKNKYHMEYSERLAKLILDEYEKSANYLDKLMEIQMNRYKQIILEKEEVAKELSDIQSRTNANGI